jgi:hypothetical protein
MTSNEIIKRLELQPHPEGGYFKETYRSRGVLHDPLYQGKRNYSTAIYYLLCNGDLSAFHRIKQDEIWHYYLGATLELHLISQSGNHQVVYIGHNIIEGEVPQFVVKGGDYFAARVVENGDYSLVGCTVSPGFDFTDFDMPPANDLKRQFPQHSKIIEQMTRF